MLRLVAIGIAAALVGWWFYPTEIEIPPYEPPKTSPRGLPETSPHEPPDPAAEKDARLRKLVVGTWQDEYKGKRTMTIRQDGTATMVVELEGLTAVLYARRLRFDMEWSIEAGRLKKRTVGGAPAGKVRLILATMGDRVDEPILELTRKRLLLLDGDGRTKYDWQRAE